MGPAGNGAPDPEQAHTPAEFVAGLQALKDWSGLPYRELSSRAEAVGDVLPRSTVANMLSRATLPREELVAAFVRACGCDPGAVDAWLRVRKELTRRERQSDEGPGAPLEAADPEDDDRTPERPAPESQARDSQARESQAPGGRAPGPEPADPVAAPPRRSWPARLVLPAAAVLGATAAAVTAVVLLADDDDRGEARRGAVVAPAPGQVRIRDVGTGLCLAERSAQDGGQVYEAPCSVTAVPRYSLERLERPERREGDSWRILSDHPDFGPGCMGARMASASGDASLEDGLCGKRGPAETFWLEPVGKPVKGYRIRLQEKRLCLGVPPGVGRPWTEVRQTACTPDGEGQLFSFDAPGGDTSESSAGGGP
ncbi:hypothetical protein AB0M39_00620 [Streptomyces sp. NPDC051907]|uniref:RICIN domain-containing protein n=1 Tax=Streptomyces sp. NPDC051907 TaxID=3155284 RepID=UPI0034479E4A